MALKVVTDDASVRQDSFSRQELVMNFIRLLFYLGNEWL